MRLINVVKYLRNDSLARGVKDNPKGLSDEMLDLIARRVGVIGVKAVPNITSAQMVTFAPTRLHGKDMALSGATRVTKVPESW